MLRRATTGDYFLIATPVMADLERLLAYQQELAAAVAGSVEEDLHLTLQRFEMPEGTNIEKALGAIQDAVSRGPAPDVIADTLMVGFHSYFKKHSIRWRIDPTAELGRLTLLSAQSIMHQGGTSHWPNAEASIAQFMTAVWMPQEHDVPESFRQGYPHRLMSASHLQVTRLAGEHRFEVVREFDIE